MTTTLKTRQTTRHIPRLYEEDDNCISAGCFGAVYPKLGSRNRVIKVSTNDDAYLSFIKHVIKHQGNPFYPHVYAATLYRKCGYYKVHEYLVVELERLKHDAPRASRLISYLQDDDKHARLKLAFQKMKLPRNRVHHFHEAFDCFQRLRGKFKSDLHEHNIMFRGNQPVLTDPVCC